MRACLCVRACVCECVSMCVREYVGVRVRVSAARVLQSKWKTPPNYKLVTHLQDI